MFLIKILILVFSINSPDNRHDFTEAFNSSEIGYTIGEGCINGNEPMTYWFYDGNLDLSCITLQLNKADLVINGTIIYNSQEVSINEMIELERISILCNESNSIEFE